MMLVFCAILWALCGVGAAGAMNAYFQRRWPTIREDADLIKAALFGLVGPMAVVAAVAFWLINARDFFSYGWSLRRNAVDGWEQR